MSLPEHAKDFKGRAKNIPEKPMRFLPYQRRWINDRSIMKLMEKSRRVGVTFGTSYAVVRRHSLKDAKDDTWFSSRDELTSRQFINYCSPFIKALDAGARDMGFKLVEKETVHTNTFSNGTSINSLASNANVFAGKGGNVGLDEFALRDDPRAVYSIAAPVIDWGGLMEIISTHRGSYNFFNEIVFEAREKGNPKGFSLHRVTLQDALDQFFLWKIQCGLPVNDPRMQMDEADYYNYQRNRCADDEQFQQEYMCNPADDAGAFLSYDMIASCEYRHGEAWETDLLDAKGALYVGVDVGRDHDLTVIWVMEKLGDTYHTRRVIELQKETFDAQEHALYQILDLPQVRRCCIDKTGIGRQFAERARARYGYRVEEVQFTIATKEEMAFPVRAAFEDKTIRIPQSNQIRSDLRGVKKESAGNNIRFTADRGKNGHSDRFWAIALALLAGKTTNEIRITVG